MRKLNAKFHILPYSDCKAHLMHIYVESDSPAKCFYSPPNLAASEQCTK